MTKAQEIAENYFKLSNEHNLDKITEMFTDSSTYSSTNTGVYLGVEEIMEMMRPFHNGFSELRWKIHSVEEVRPGVVLIDFTMNGIKTNGEKIERAGLEYVIVHDRKIQHIEVRNK